MIIAEAPATGALARSKYPDHHLRDFRLQELILYQLQFLSVLHGNQSRAKKHEFPEPPAWLKQEQLTNEWAPDQPGKWGSATPIDELNQFLGIDPEARSV